MPNVAGQHRPRVLSIRRRYVNRARFLIEHPPFRRDIERRRIAWDATWPEFAIGPPSVPPFKPGQSLGTGDFIPSKLHAAIRAKNDVLKKKRPRPRDFDAVAGRAGWAGLAWRQLLADICAEWWPAEYYPLTGPAHPATQFAAGCLLFSPQSALEEWIARPTLSAYPLSVPIERMVVPWELAEWKGRAEALSVSLRGAAEAGQMLTPELVAEFEQGALEAGKASFRACQQELLALTPDGLPQEHWVVPVFPGMAWEDWEQALPNVLATLRYTYGEHHLRKVARRLHLEGRSVRAIAGLLGVSRPTVDDWLAGPD